MPGNEQLLKCMFSTDPFFEDQAKRCFLHIQFGGADFGECLGTMQRVPPGDIAAWYREWTATADRVAAIGHESAKRGHHVSAREAYLRASNYYRTSYVMHYGAPVAPEVSNGFAKESATFRAFAERMNPLVEAVEIPYEGTSLPGYFCRAPGVSNRAPTLVATNGYDATLHEMYFAFAPAANRRGYHCLIFDGPGQG